MANQIYFVDSKLNNYEEIISSFSEDDKYYLIDSNKDGFSQIIGVLSKYKEVEAVHVYTHGDVGSMSIGNSVLDNANVDKYKEGLEEIGRSLSSTGDILLYGCNVGKDEEGKEFVNKIAQYTQADVAASNDLTGASALGGDWDLEVRSGDIETKSNEIKVDNILILDKVWLFAQGVATFTSYATGMLVATFIKLTNEVTLGTADFALTILDLLDTYTWADYLIPTDLLKSTHAFVNAWQDSVNDLANLAQLRAANDLVSMGYLMDGIPLEQQGNMGKYSTWEEYAEANPTSANVMNIATGGVAFVASLRTKLTTKLVFEDINLGKAYKDFMEAKQLVSKNLDDPVALENFKKASNVVTNAVKENSSYIGKAIVAETKLLGELMQNKTLLKKYSMATDEIIDIANVANYGFSAEIINKTKDILSKIDIMRDGVRIELDAIFRTPNPECLKRIMDGHIFKPMEIKIKTLKDIDFFLNPDYIKLGKEKFNDDIVGFVAVYKPTDKISNELVTNYAKHLGLDISNSADLSFAKKQLEDAQKKRLKEWDNQSEYIDNSKGQFDINPETGLITAKDDITGQLKNITGDYDLWDVRGVNGELLTDEELVKVMNQLQQYDTGKLVGGPYTVTVHDGVVTYKPYEVSELDIQKYMQNNDGVSYNTAKSTLLMKQVNLKRDLVQDGIDGKLISVSDNGTIKTQTAINTADNKLIDQTFSLNTVKYVVKDGKIIYNAITDDVVISDNNESSISYNGYRETSVGPNSDYFFTNPHVIIQSDGKILVAGTTKRSIGDQEFTIIRYNTDGSLDDSLYYTGIQNLIPHAGGLSELNNVHVLSDGSILLVGSTWERYILDYANSDGANRIVMLKIKPDGYYDTSFGTEGKVISYDSTLESVAQDYSAVQADGKILITAISTIDGQKGLIIYRYNPNGSLDTTFGDGSGWVGLPIDGWDFVSISSIQIQSNGKILIAGTSDASEMLLRFNSNGTPDTTFGTNGESIGESAFETVATEILSDGNILVVGNNTSGGYSVNKIRPDGDINYTFLMSEDIGKVVDVEIQTDGKVVLALFINDNYVIKRLNQDASIDTSFGYNGLKTIDFGGMDIPTSLKIQSDGKIVVTGYSNSGVNQIARLNSDGTFDDTFGNTSTTPSTPVEKELPTISIKSDGDVIETDDTTVQATFTVSLSKVTDHDVTFFYVKDGGTATKNIDYNGSLGRGVIKKGELSTKISVDVYGDNVYEENETFRVNLKNIDGATLAHIRTDKLLYPGHTQGAFKNQGAFAAIKEDGSVVTWGDDGGDSSNVASKIDGTIDVVDIYSTYYAFAALREDGSVVTWGESFNGGDSSNVVSKLDGTIDVVDIYSARYAFAALRADGSVVTWGVDGGNSSSVASKLDGTIDVVDIYSTIWAFAALRADGSVVTWGNSDFGGDSSHVALDGTIDVVDIYSTDTAFAALRADGSVLTWGKPFYGAESRIDSLIDGTIDIISISSTESAFAALRADGSVVTWGNSRYGGDSTSVSSKIDGTIDVVDIYSSNEAFAALRADGSVVTWGRNDSSSVASLIDGTIDVVNIYSTYYSFAALREDGSVVTWGYDDDIRVVSKLDGTIDVVDIYSTINNAFAALREDGSVVTWGNPSYGGDCSSVASKLDGTIDVVDIYSTGSAFAALREDGSVVTWGNSFYDAGDSSSVADKLTSGVVSISNDEFNQKFEKPLNQVTIINDDTKVIPVISSLDKTVVETDNSQVVQVKVKLSSIASDDVTISYKTQSKSAIAGTDYTATSGTLKIAEGKDYGYINIEVLGDTTFEGDEYFSLILSDPVNATLASTNNTTFESKIKIIENDLPTDTTKKYIVTDYVANSEDKDFTIGSSASAKIVGNSLDNSFIVNNGNNNIDGGIGIDTLSFTNSYGNVSINLGVKTAQNTINSGTITVSNIENVIGSSYDDVITGNELRNVIEGSSGNDEIDGGSENDTVVFSGNESEYVIDKTSNDFILVTDTVSNRDGIDKLINVEYFRFSDTTFSLNDDHSNTNTNATTLTLGTTTNGNIEIATDVDCFKIDLVAGQKYLFQMNDLTLGTNGYAYLELSDSNNNYLSSGSENNNVAQLSYTATTSGTYYLKAKSSSDSIGTYDVKVTEVLTIDDHSDTSTNATALTLNTTTNGNIEVATDEDYFKIDLVAGQKYLFQMNDLTLGTNGYAYLNLFDSNNNYLSSGSENNNVAQLSYTATTSGTYYLKAKSSSDSIGTYDVKVTEVLTIDDHSDTSTNATALTLNTTTNGNIEVATDEDYFKIDLVAGQKYLFQMNDLTLGTNGYAYLNLFDSNEDYLNYAGEQNNIAQLEYIATTSGTYYLKAKSSSDSTGTYDVKVSEVLTIDDHSDTSTNATALTLNTTTNGNIEIATDVDYFKIDLVAGQKYLFQMNDLTLGANGYAYLELYNFNEDYLNYAGEQNNIAQLEYIATTSGTYYLIANASSDSTGTYTIKASEVTGVAPTITNQTTIVNVTENQDSSIVIYKVEATDVDANTTLAYSLSGTDANLLNINSVTGEITLKNKADYEVKRNYVFDVVASDGILTDSKTITVNVNDVVESKKSVKYFVSGTANNFLEFDLDYASVGLSLAGSEVMYTGNSGVENVYVGSNVNFDFTKASNGVDKVYLKNGFGDYDYSYQGTTLLLTQKSSGAQIKIAAGSIYSYDKIMFADGSVKSTNLYEAIKTNGISQLVLDVDKTPINKSDLYTSLGTQNVNVIKAFAATNDGATFATSPKSGTSMILNGGSGVDVTYVSSYSTVDATKLSGGIDLVYLNGKLSDYNCSNSGTTLVLTRNNGLDVETVKVAGGSNLSYDKLVFANGYVKSIDLYNAIKNNTVMPNLDSSMMTPISIVNKELTITSKLDGIMNLDVRSNVVLECSENVSAIAGKYIRIVNDVNTSDKNGLNQENVINSFVLETIDSRISIVGNKIIINLDKDLDFSNNYHVEIDAGAFKGNESQILNQTISDSITINFATVNPSVDKDVNTLDGLSQIMENDGNLINSLIWKDVEGWGSKTGSQSAVDMSKANVGLVITDLDVKQSVYDLSNPKVNATNVQTSNFNLGLNNLGINDLIYLDDMGRNNEDLTKTLELVFAIQGTTNGINTNFNFDAAPTKDGGSIDILNQSFSTVDEWKTLLNSNTNPFVIG